jgi:hypothetical protein
MPSPRLSAFSALAEAIGPDAALELVGFAGGHTLYAPEKYTPGHLLERVIGEAGFLRLISSYGGETLTIPQTRIDAARRIGAVYRGSRTGLTTRQIASELGITFRRVRQLEVAIKAGGPLTPLARSQKPPFPSAERSP